MYKITVLLSLAILLLACESTQNSTYTHKTYEQTLNDTIAQTEEELSSTGASKRFALATIYNLSLDQETRAKAIPILKDLESEGNIEAINFLVSAEYIGSLGYVSSSTLKKHEALLKQHHPDTLSDIEAELQQWSQAYSNHFSSVKEAYDNGLKFCQQPVANMPLSLDTITDYKFPQYLTHCLSSYSHQSNASDRLESIAALQEAACLNNEKTCISKGYRLLARNEFSDQSSTEELLSMATALRAIFNKYKNYLDNTSKLTVDYVSKNVGKQITNAFARYNEGDNAGALSILSTLSTTLEEHSFDKAYVDSFVAKLLVAEADTTEQRQNAISWFNKALSTKKLNNKEQWESSLLLGDLLMLNEDYRAYAFHVASIINASEKYKGLIPQDTLSSILTKWQM